MDEGISVIPKFQPVSGGVSAGSAERPSIALLPAGGDLWEDFLDSTGVPLDRFCAEGPGGWMLGYMDALNRAGVRTVLIFFSARVPGPSRYRDAATGNMITILPAPALYRRLRTRLPIYRNARSGPALRGLKGVAAKVLRAILSHMSTPMRALACELRDEDCTAILCQEYEYFRFGAVVALGRLLKLPVFATFQGATAELNVLSRPFKPWVMRGSAGLIVAASTEIRRIRETYGSRIRVVQIFNPVDVGHWSGEEREEARAAIGAGTQTRVALWHGRISIYSKGLDVMLAAWKRVREQRPAQDLRLRLMGTGEDAPEFGRRIAELGSFGIEWTNEYVTDRRAIRRFLAGGDVFAFPSRLEGFAVAPIEAMACGLPIVAADASGVPDMFHDGAASGGLVVPRGDIEAFAAALGRVLDDPARGAELGLRARARVEAAFSLEAVGMQLRTALFGAEARVGAHA